MTDVLRLGEAPPCLDDEEISLIAPLTNGDLGHLEDPGALLCLGAGVPSPFIATPRAGAASTSSGSLCDSYWQILSYLELIAFLTTLAVFRLLTCERATGWYCSEYTPGETLALRFFVFNSAISKLRLVSGAGQLKAMSTCISHCVCSLQKGEA